MAIDFNSYSGETLSREEFETLALQQLDGLYAAARHLCKNEADAQDLVHDAYLRALRFYKSFQPGTNFRGWIFRLMYRLFINRYHQQQREREHILSSDDHLSLIPDKGQGPELSAIMRLEAESVEKALAELPELYRSVVILCDVNEFSYEEIAAILDLPIGTVMSRLFRGRRQLRQILAAEAEQKAKQQKEAPIDINMYRRERGIVNGMR